MQNTENLGHWNMRTKESTSIVINKEHTNNLFAANKNKSFDEQPKSNEQADQPRQPPQPPKKLGLRIISEEEAAQLDLNRSEKQRKENIKLLFIQRPDKFDLEDQAEAEFHQGEIRKVGYLAFLALMGTSALRIWFIKTRS